KNSCGIFRNAITRSLNNRVRWHHFERACWRCASRSTTVEGVLGVDLNDGVYSGTISSSIRLMSSGSACKESARSRDRDSLTELRAGGGAIKRRILEWAVETRFSALCEISSNNFSPGLVPVNSI